MKSLLAATSLVALLAAAPAFAQTGATAAPVTGSSGTNHSPSSAGRATSGSGSSSATQLSAADRKFLEEAAMGGNAEVELGRMAQQKGGSAAVKQFGQRMVDDHSKANQQLQLVAQQLGITPPTKAEPHAAQLMKRLSGESGTAFDRAYMKDMVSDHEKDVKAFEKEAQDGRSTELKSFAQQTLPVLKQHLEMARQVAGEKQSGSSATQRQRMADAGSAPKTGDAATNADTSRLNDQELSRLQGGQQQQ